MSIEDVPNPENAFKEYDFNEPTTVDKGLVNYIRFKHLPISKAFKAALFSRYRCECEVTLLEMEQIVSNTYLSKIDIPSVAFLFNQNSIGDWALMHFDMDFCVNIVEYLSGNKRLHSKLSRRPLTTIEQRVMHHVADMLMEEVRKVLASVLPIESAPITFISDFSGLRALSNKWIGLRVRYEISYLDKRNSFEVVYSYDHLEQVVDVPSKTVADEKDIDDRERVSRSRLEVSLKKTDIDMTALLGTTKMPLRRVLALKKDDIITLDQKITQPLDVQVSGKTKFTAYPGRRGYNYAMRIFSVRED